MMLARAESYGLHERKDGAGEIQSMYLEVRQQAVRRSMLPHILFGVN